MPPLTPPKGENSRHTGPAYLKIKIELKFLIYDDRMNEDDVEVVMLIKDLNRSLSFGEGDGGRGRMNRITER